MADNTYLYNQANRLVADTNFGISLFRDGAQQNINSILLGANLQAQGSIFAAQSLRQAASLVGKASDFNLYIDSINTLRSVKELAKDYQLTSGKQLSQQAATGFAVGSKSFEMTRAENLQNATTRILETKLDAENVRRAKLFETQIQQTNIENQARAKEYEAQVTKVLAQDQANTVSMNANAQIARARQQLNSQVGSLLGGRK